MSNSSTFPSCIKMPPTSLKQCAVFPQKLDVIEVTALNAKLIVLANDMFGERRWSHSVVNQTIDFVDAFMGKYVCGCTTFLKIQLKDGTFHEDMGYCHAEGAMKGLSIHCARIGSHLDAFGRVLSCFGDDAHHRVLKLSRKFLNSSTHNVHKEDTYFSVPSVQADLPAPCAQSTPIPTSNKNNEQKQIPEEVKISNNQEEQALWKAINQVEEKVLAKTSSEVKDQLPNEPDNQQAKDKKKTMSEEEFLRLERKRKQMEKQAEYKRLMKEREQQKLEDKKSNPK